LKQSVTPDVGRDSGPTRNRKNLSLRLDDLRGFGLLPAGGDSEIQGEEALIELCLKLVDSLESTQRRVIETSIQILSLRELVAKLLSLRTPEAVAETVALYLLKAFDHERVLVGVHDPITGTLEGWLAASDRDTECTQFLLNTTFEGALLGCLNSGRPVHATSADDPPFLLGTDLPVELEPFTSGNLGPYLAFPLPGGVERPEKTVGVMVVGRSADGKPITDTDLGILESVVEAVGTALENVILEEDVRREEAFRKDIMGSMSSSLIAVDLDGRVLTMNAATGAMTGFSIGELRGETVVPLNPPGGGLAELLEKTLKTGLPILGLERAVRRADNSAFPASCATALLRNPQGDVYGAVVTFSDLTEIKGMEQHIRSLDRLAALGRFTAGIAHEIRNPLTGIGTGVQYLERHIQDPDQNENLRFIQREIDRLNRIVEDLFRVTHPHPVRKVPEDALGMVERAAQALGDVAEQRGIRLTYHVEENLPPIGVDPDQIQQVLLNLLKNAVEASPDEGEVAVHIYTSSDESRPQMVYQIIDEGSGIAPESQPHVFEPFYTKGKPDGTGLGLYVSHGIVERHGGELHAANENNGGAIFTLMLPLHTYDSTEML
jgi:PAS domain S-box-containing protein